MPETIKNFPNDTLQYIFYESVGHLISSEREMEIQLNLMNEVLGQFII